MEKQQPEKVEGVVNKIVQNSGDDTASLEDVEISMGSEGSA
jgi:hypothetical protein